MSSYRLAVEDALPASFKYELIHSKCGPNEVFLRASIQSEEDIKNWILAFGRNSGTQWNLRTSKPNGTYIVCMRKYVCHHSAFMKVERSANKKGISKNADCGASITISVKAYSKKMRTKKDAFMEAGLWASVRIGTEHTHSLGTVETLRFLQDKDGSLKAQFFDYFADNMSAADAKRFYEISLRDRDTVSEADFASGNINPTDETVNYWYRLWKKEYVGPRSGKQLLEKLSEKIAAYEDSGVTVAISTDPLCILVVTPIMRRAGELPLAKELAFIDTTSACDVDCHSVTFVLTPCPAGAIPLGILITCGQSAETYQTAFRLLRRHVCLSPRIILTDDSAEESAAIEEVWPEATHFWCIFHVLQAIWRWLWDAQNEIAAEDRAPMMNGFKKVLYLADLHEIEEAFTKCVDEFSAKYPQWSTYIASYWPSREKWCLAYRDQTVRGHHTNNFSEASIRIFKDVVLSRLKVQNVVSLVDFCATKLEEYNTKKLRDFANFRKRKSYSFFLNTLKKCSYISADEIVRVDENTFIVPSAEGAGKTYTVESDVGSCTCPDGRYGRFCKHQSAVYKFFQVRAHNFPAVTAASRYEMAKLALGPERVPAPSFYEDFLPENPNERTLSNVDQPVIDVQNDAIACASTSSCSEPVDRAVHCSESEEDVSSEMSWQWDEPEDGGSSETSQRDALLATISQKIEEKVRAVTFDEEVSAALQEYASRIDRVQSKDELLHFLQNTSGSKRRKTGQSQEDENGPKLSY